MNFDASGLVQKLKDGLELARGLAAVPAQLGFPMPAAITTGISIVQGLTTVGSKVLERVKEGAVVIASDDEAEIVRLLKDLQAENDALAAKVAAS